MYQNITAGADIAVRIKTHPLKRKTIPTNIFVEKETEEEKEEEDVLDEPKQKKQSKKKL